MSIELFKDSKGTIHTQSSIIEALKDLGADQADLLYIHSDIGFGKPLVKRNVLVEKLYECLESLGVNTLIFPTYTFSFCNRQDYDIQQSKTSMGMLNEYVRKRDSAYRTEDPILSVCVIGEIPGSYHHLSRESCGRGSAFDVVAESDRNMILFFGTKPTECMSFLHWVEAIYDVPYRYNKPFSGKVIDNGTETEVTYNLFSLYDTVIPEVDIHFQNHLEQANILKKNMLGEKELFLVKGKSLFEETMKLLDKDINILLARPYDLHELGTNYRYENVNSIA